MTQSSTFEAGAQRGYAAAPATRSRARARLSPGLGLVIAATLSGVLWVPIVMAAHALVA
jgi:hypothetical protein